MFEKILLPLDGSKVAEEILPYAEQVAARLRSSVVVLNVASHSGVEREISRAYVESAVTSLNEELGHMVDRPDRDQSAAPRAFGEVRTGYPAEEIYRYAADNNFDFIMISAFGQSGVRRWRLGGTAEKVTRVSSVPVWIVRSSYSGNTKNISWPINNILVPLDGSKLGECVIPFIKEMTNLTLTKNAEITLLNVNEPLLINADYPEKTMRLGWDEHVKRQTVWIEKISREYLNNIKLKLEESRLKVNVEIIIGNPAETILNYAASKPVNLIILASHGRTGITSLENGNVADNILHRSQIPIILVRPGACLTE